MGLHLLALRQGVNRMLLRPVDASGDILPVLSSSDLVSDPESVVLLVRDRLNLLSGEWWENPSWGCEIFDMIRSGRVTESDISTLASYLSSYIHATPGVKSVEDVQTAVSGRQFTYSCQALTEQGSSPVQYEVSL